jgi:hypothetical protein
MMSIIPPSSSSFIPFLSIIIIILILNNYVKSEKVYVKEPSCPVRRGQIKPYQITNEPRTNMQL